MAPNMTCKNYMIFKYLFAELREALFLPWLLTVDLALCLALSAEIAFPALTYGQAVHNTAFLY
jgi:hypothetical protein